LNTDNIIVIVISQIGPICMLPKFK